MWVSGATVLAVLGGLGAYRGLDMPWPVTEGALAEWVGEHDRLHSDQFADLAERVAENKEVLDQLSLATLYQRLYALEDLVAKHPESQELRRQLQQVRQAIRALEERGGR